VQKILYGIPMKNNCTEIIAIRHGETEWNRIGRQQGHLDSNLTRHGIRQAKMIARYLKNTYFDSIYCSDLGRAAQTAGIIAKKLKVKIIKESGLRERNLGIMQGLTVEEFRHRYPEEYKKYISDDPDYALPDGESVRQRHDRTINTLKEIVDKNRDKKIIAVMHGGNLDSLFRYVLGIPLNQKRNFSLLNSSLNIFVVEDNIWKLKSWGEISYLKGLTALDDF
jgi:probable phosphoglycerate mutase